MIQIYWIGVVCGKDLFEWLKEGGAIATAKKPPF
jgi:hypothetical protein